MNYPEYLKSIIPNKYHKYLIDYQKLSDILCEKDFVEKFEYSFIKSFDEEYSKFTEVYDNEYHILYFKYLDLMNVEADLNGLLCNGMCLDEDINDLLKYVTGNINGLKKLAKKHDLLSSNEIYSIFRKRFRGDVSKINSLKNDMEILLKEIKNQNSSDIFIQKYKINTFLMINGNKDLSKYYETCDNKEIENSETNRISEIYLDNDNFDVYTATLYLNIQSSIIKMTWVLNNPTNYILASKKTIDYFNEEYEIDFKLERKNLLDFLNQKDVWEDICDLNLNNEYVKACYYEIKNDLKNKSLKIKCKISYTILKIKRSDCNCEFSLKYDIIIHKLDNNLLETEDDVLMKVPYGIITLKYSEDEEKITQILERLRSANIEEYNYFNLFVFSTIMIYEDVKEIPKWMHHLSIKRLKQDFTEQIQQNEEIIEIYNNSKEASRFNNGTLFDFERDTFEQRIIVINTNKFLNWLCFSVILGGIGALTISLDSALFIFSGTCLVLLSLLSCFYAVYLYFKKKNHSHENINYLELPVLDDPVALVGVIFFILIVSLISFLP